MTASPADRRPIKARNTRWARAVASRLAAAGVSPNAISIAGMAAAIAAGAALYFTRQEIAAAPALWSVAAFLLFLRLLANMFDGMVAIESGKASSVGELYNEVPDRVSDAAIFTGAGYAAGGSVELGLAAACVGLFVAYVRAAARVAGAPSDYSGPMAKQQRMHVMIAACFINGAAALISAKRLLSWGPGGEWGVMAAALSVVIAGGVITAALRLRTAARRLRGTDPGV